MKNKKLREFESDFDFESESQIIIIPRHEWKLPDRDSPSLKDLVQKTPFFLTKTQTKDGWPNMAWKIEDIFCYGIDSMHILAIKAMRGNAHAAVQLAELAKRATSYLTEVCQSKPEMVRSLARVEREWPVIKRRKDRLSANEAKLFEEIQLAQDDFIEIHAQTTKWKIDYAWKIAYSLVVFIRNARDGSASSMIDFGPRTPMPPKKVMVGHLPSHRSGARSRISENARKKLKSDFSEECVQEWWDFAKEFVLLATYPNLLSIPEFDEMAPKINRTTRKKYPPSKREEKIIDVLKRRFFSLARNRSFD